MSETVVENPPLRKTVIFSHGKESGPWGIKITRLAPVAEELDFHVLSIDYRGVYDPVERARMLLAQCPKDDGMTVLAGSSMGGAFRWRQLR